MWPEYFMLRTAPPETMLRDCRDSSFLDRVERTSDPLRVKAYFNLVSSWV